MLAVGRAAAAMLRTASGFSPTFPGVSTRKSRPPQLSHNRPAVSDCRPHRNAPKFSHCKRERCAASDRVRLVLRQLTGNRSGSAERHYGERSPVNCRAVPEACKRCGQPGRCGLLRNGLALRDCQPPSAIRVRTRLGCGRVHHCRSRTSRGAGAPGARSAGECAGRSEVHACECGPGGWPGPRSFWGYLPGRRAQIVPAALQASALGSLANRV
jgi:hypothetical protein